MKIIFVAQLAKEHDRDDLWLDGFKRMGLNVIPFSTIGNEYRLKKFNHRLASRLHVGKKFSQMREKLVNLVEQEKPDWVHFRLPLHFNLKTLQRLKNEGVMLTSYYNDDPFSSKRLLGLHSMFIKCISLYDAHFVFRKKNVDEFIRHGAPRVLHCAPFFDPVYHKPPLDHQPIKYDYDAVFIGHWENDGRIKYLESLLSNGYVIKVRGPLWDKASRGTQLQNLVPFAPIFGKKYARLYRNSYAGLCFFSKLNNDSWTRRPLEIVASGGLLVCQRTKEAESYFKDCEEAFFFSSVAELLLVMKFIFENPEKAVLVRSQGHKRLFSGKHTIMDRIEMMQNVVMEICNK